jgi:membrane protease YdiL (CAAX protease family)
MRKAGDRDRWIVPGRVLLFVCSCAVVVAAVAPICGPLAAGWRELAIGTITSAGAYVLTAAFVRWDGIRMADVGAAAGRRTLARLVFGVLVGLVLVTLWAFVIMIAGDGRWTRAAGVDFRAVAVTLAGYFALACREELAFRGYPLRRLEAPGGPWVAQIVVAVLFAAEHKLGGWTWVDAFLGPAVGSLLFGMAALKTGGLGVPIGLHFAWNFGQWFLGLKTSAGFLRVVALKGSETRLHAIGMIAYVAVTTAATVAFWIVYRNRRGEE